MSVGELILSLTKCSTWEIDPASCLGSRIELALVGGEEVLLVTQTQRHEGMRAGELVG